jgi:hypothetical protein
MGEEDRERGGEHIGLLEIRDAFPSVCAWHAGVRETQ